MALSSTHAPYVHLPPEYKPQLDVSLPPKGDPKFLACCILSEILPQFKFGEFPHYPLETNTPVTLNGPTSINPVDLSQVSVEARQLFHLYLSTTRLKCAGAPSCMKCTSWHAGQEIRRVVFRPVSLSGSMWGTNKL
jgi:hypothetical protein